MDLQLGPAREQKERADIPYDRWVSPGGVCQAEFFRSNTGFYIRFPRQADFEITASSASANKIEDFRVEGWPAPGCDSKVAVNLFHNGITPILGNHCGGLFLHGSAVRIGAGEHEAAVAFLGLSRGGKTTLAGAFAKAGHPFLTEDVIDLDCNDGSYWLRSKRSKLRLFEDSAKHLMGPKARFQNNLEKLDVEAGNLLPFAGRAAPLRQIYVLGTDHSAPLSIKRLTLQSSLTVLMPHSFILDVNDKEWLRGHFLRLADLAQDIGCYALDYPRNYAELPHVIDAILANFRGGQAS
jgi:hypothetical protein